MIEKEKEEFKHLLLLLQYENFETKADLNLAFLCVVLRGYTDCGKRILGGHSSKASFTHPVSACVFRIALRFFITYLG